MTAQQVNQTSSRTSLLSFLLFLFLLLSLFIWSFGYRSSGSLSRTRTVSDVRLPSFSSSLFIFNRAPVSRGVVGQWPYSDFLFIVKLIPCLLILNGFCVFFFFICIFFFLNVCFVNVCSSFFKGILLYIYLYTYILKVVSYFG